ncbi:hypothetical protein RSC2_02445 [Bacillus paralicheniformis]|nr:hypothetical protein RSC1_00608 [Bacillus paralicheniformis]BCE10649.1 hypothetical protein RSC2_02445 [Bacillus paralicheniformis]BCE16868.1 hypothetical protein RSC3_04224 [Bacillus paralicheniformis]
MKEAKKLGLQIEDVKEFLHSQPVQSDAEKPIKQ